VEVEINWLAVILAAISNFVVAAVWYSPPLFMRPWLADTGVSHEKFASGFGKSLGVSVVTAFLLAFTIAYVAGLGREVYGGGTFTAAMFSALGLWLGIAFAVALAANVFEGRPVRLTVVQAGGTLVTMAVMGLIIGLLGGF